MSDLKYPHRGLIVYCDGSIFGKATQTTPVGSGVHAVLFSDEPYDGRVLEKEHLFTTKGYLYKEDFKKDPLKPFDKEGTSKEAFLKAFDKDIRSAKPIWIREYAFAWKKFGTNSVAELRGMAEALKLILEVKADCSVVYSDSEYVLNSLSKHLPKWIKNNWITSSGQPVANQDCWMEIYELIKEITKLDLKYFLRKIKGHKEAKGDKNSAVNMSNEYADQMASIASSMANNIQHPEYVHSIRAEPFEPYGNDGSYGALFEQTLEESLKERHPKKIHPFLINKRYYTGWGIRPNRTRHYIGNPGQGTEDIYIGKQISDAQLGIIQLSEEDEVINRIEDVQNAWLRQHYQHDNYVTTYMLDTISNSKDYALLERYGYSWLSRKPGVPNLKAINGKEITYVNDPLYLALENIKFLKEMENILSLYGNTSINVTDITDTLYETVEVKASDDIVAEEKQDTLKVGKVLLKTIDGTTKFIEPTVKFGGDGKLKETALPITLTTGIDIPRRNQLKSVESDYPSVKVLTWNKDGLLYAFGILIFTHKLVDDKLVRTGYGFWRGTFSSQLYVKQ